MLETEVVWVSGVSIELLFSQRFEYRDCFHTSLRVAECLGDDEVQAAAQ